MASDGKEVYEFTEAGFYMGDYYKVGDRIRLLPAQAKYDLHRLKRVTE